MCGEAEKVNNRNIEAWFEDHCSIFLDYYPRDIINADESGWFYKMQPIRTLRFEGLSCHNHKNIIRPAFWAANIATKKKLAWTTQSSAIG